jgi:hypothetical protein
MRGEPSRYNERELQPEVTGMVVVRKPDVKDLFLDKKEVQRLVAEQYAIMGLEYDPTATPQKAREMMRALGIKPEENLISGGIIAAREE